MNFYRMTDEEKIKLFEKILDTRDKYPNMSLTKIAERFGLVFWQFVALRKFIQAEADNDNQHCSYLLTRFRNG